MFTDEHRCKVWDRIRQHGLRAFGKLLSAEVLAEAARQAGLRVGASPLNLVNLAWLGIAAAIQRGRGFADVLVLTLKLLNDSPDWHGSPIAAAQRKGRRRQKRRRGKKRRGGLEYSFSYRHSVCQRGVAEKGCALVLDRSLKSFAARSPFN